MDNVEYMYNVIRVKVKRYRRGNQKQYIEERHAIHYLKEKRQKTQMDRKHYTENIRLSNMNLELTKNWTE
jgi:hypothetical protein